MIELNIRGAQPAPWGTKKQWEWRKRIKNNVKKQLKGRRLDSLKNKKFKVTIIFYLSPNNILHTDLDNLAKPVLDTLFKIKNPQSKAKENNLTGALFSVDDENVYELVLRKEKSISNAGTNIKIEWF